jgi:hypothetical protein
VKVGTKSLLFGVHQIALHGPFVWLAWRRVYGAWPDWRTTISAVIHDIGYFGCGDMDGREGIDHPELGARLAGRWLGREQHAMVLFHSRSKARRHRANVSALCLPDKLSVFLYPSWLYTLLAVLSGEYREYQARLGLEGEPRRLLIHRFRVFAFEWALANAGSELIDRIVGEFGDVYRKSFALISHADAPRTASLRSRS